MKIKVPMMVDDPLAQKSRKLTENVTLSEDFFLEGPVSRRVAVIDFDEKNGSLRPGARLSYSGTGKIAGYVVPENIYSRAFNQVSVFATVLKTMYLFEGPDVLGRKLTWGFGGPQLLVVPRAGEWENAFYDRDSRSLQFFSFRSRGDDRGRIFTSLSRDIVAHETGHAVIDGIAPDLYHAVTPQSLALHEAMADLTALCSAFNSSTLRTQVLKETGNRIDVPNAFSAIAPQFGVGRDGLPASRADLTNHALRILLNDRKLDPLETEPHELSEVLSGALYQLMIRIFARLAMEKPEARLGTAGRFFRRIVFRALDYLPPGEISFADYARALIASDEASYPADDTYRRAVTDEFLKRDIVSSRDDLAVDTNFTDSALDGIDLETLLNRDWAAYDFANRHRRLLRIPDDGRPFHVRPRLHVKKTYNRGVDRFEEVEELIFKVSWDVEEPNPVRGAPPKRQVTAGTMMAIDWQTREIRALLTSDHKSQRKSRDAMVKRLDGDGRLLPLHELMTAGGRPLRHAVGYEATGNVMRIRGGASLLHIARMQSHG